MSQSKKKHYKKRKPAAHIQPKKNNAGTNPNQKQAKEMTKREQFLENWLWLITLIAIVIIGVLLVVLIPKLDSCEALNSCGKKAEQVEDNIEQDITSAADFVVSAADSTLDGVVSAAEAALTTTTASETTTTTTTTTTVSPAAALGLDTFDPSEFTEQLKKPASGEEIAVFETNMGKIRMRLFPDAAPKSVENFKKHISDGYYNNTTFHRVINGFMIQGGDPTATGSGGESIWGGNFEDEYENGLYNFRGALSMANTGDPDTNNSQFFIVQNNDLSGDLANDGYNIYKQYYPEWAVKTYFKLGGYPMGDHELYEATHYNGHTVFGQVFEGMDVVDNIAAVEVVDASAQNYKPVQDVTINRAYLEKYEG